MNAAEILQERTAKAAEILKTDKAIISLALVNMGVEEDEFSLKLLSQSTALEDFMRALEEAGSAPTSSSENGPDGLVYTGSVGGEYKLPALPRLRAAFDVLQGRDMPDQTATGSTGDTNQVAFMYKPTGQWSNEELLQSYSKDGTGVNVEEELERRGKGKPFIVFNDDESVDIESSVKMLKKARSNPKMPERFPVDGELKRLYRVGEFPLDFLFECPFHPEVLLVDGYCEVSGIVWVTLNEEHMQLCRMIDDDHDISDMDQKKLAKTSIKEIKEMFPNTAAKFEEQKELGQLKSLKRKISQGGGRDPFHVKY